jgi:hypothetical protein
MKRFENNRWDTTICEGPEQSLLLMPLAVDQTSNRLRLYPNTASINIP